MAWRTATNWHLTRSLAEEAAKDFRKRYPNDKFRVLKWKKNWAVQVWATSVPIKTGRE